MRMFKTLEVNPPQNVVDRELWRKAIRFQFIYSLAGLILGLACVIGGIILFFHGIIGPTANWTTSALGINISDAAPGVVLFVVGLLFVWITRFSVRTGQSQDNSGQA
ncbi:MAG: hypothetical protein ABSE68_02265 [Minisyncoccia bacterium]